MRWTKLVNFFGSLKIRHDENDTVYLHFSGYMDNLPSKGKLRFGSLNFERWYIDASSNVLYVNLLSPPCYGVGNSWSDDDFSNGKVLSELPFWRFEFTSDDDRETFMSSDFVSTIRCCNACWRSCSS